VEALGRIGDPTAVPLLIHLLQRGQEDVRLAAAAALGRLGDQPAVAALKKTSQTDVVESVRDAALAALEGR
jgi:HEAT repeat protein